MASASNSFHEDAERLRPETMEAHRGVATLLEELDAIDWYDQRLDATADPGLQAILRHNRDEEKEHAMMVLEWLRRHDPALDGHMRTYLFTENDIAASEEKAAGDADSQAGDEPESNDSLAIGTLRGDL